MFTGIEIVAEEQDEVDFDFDFSWPALSGGTGGFLLAQQALAATLFPASPPAMVPEPASSLVRPSSVGSEPVKFKEMNMVM